MCGFNETHPSPTSDFTGFPPSFGSFLYAGLSVYPAWAKGGRNPAHYAGMRILGGVGGIRTPGPREGPPPFQDGAIDRSATTPMFRLLLRRGRFVAPECGSHARPIRAPTAGESYPKTVSRSGLRCPERTNPSPEDLSFIVHPEIISKRKKGRFRFFWWIAENLHVGYDVLISNGDERCLTIIKPNGPKSSPKTGRSCS